MWVKISDDWIDSRHVEDLGAEAVALHISALSFCSRQSTDGELPSRDLRKLWPADDLAASVARLEAAGEWETTDTGWHLVNWQQHLLSKAEVAHKREQSRITTERYRRHKDGDHSMCDRCSFKRDDASRDKSQQTSVTPLSSLRLDTSRLVSKRSERDETESGTPGSASAPPDAPQKKAPIVHPARGTDPYNCLCGLPVVHPLHQEVSA